MFGRVLVANRGEIAVRVMRACRELDIETVAVYSDADRDAGHVRYADEAYNIGPPPASESYLDGDAIIEVATRAEVDAIHPGYGFLAENAAFAAQVEASELTWIGPPSDVMRQVGTKTDGRTVMTEAGVPVVPGTTDPIQRSEDVESFAAEHGYPVVIKADAGGGGRGMVVINEQADIADAIARAEREGEAYFGDDRIYVEKFLARPKHVEVQVIADHHGNVRHLGERDCSLQRRHQKVIEEAPAPGLDDDIRDALGNAACRGLADVGYTNAGTVEFLVDGDDYYFMEVNTRIQVEHPASECITGLDIVKWQLRVAAGEPISFEQDDVSFDGHAIEYRINAEHPANAFAPTPGKLTSFELPGGIGVRVDTAVREGDTISGDYDSMIAKFIIHASDREECLKRSERALRECEINGVHTTIPFHRMMLRDQAFRKGTHHTRYLDEKVEEEALADAVNMWGPSTTPSGDDTEPVERSYTIEVNDKRFAVDLIDHNQQEAQQPVSAPTAKPRASETSRSPSAGTPGESIVAEMQGTVLSVAVTEGDSVEPGDVICVVEAMKMENDIVTSAAGEVTQVPITEGDTVDMGDLLCVIE